MQMTDGLSSICDKACSEFVVIKRYTHKHAVHVVCIGRAMLEITDTIALLSCANHVQYLQHAHYVPISAG